MLSAGLQSGIFVVPVVEGSAFVPFSGSGWTTFSAHSYERIVNKANGIVFGGFRPQIPAGRCRRHHVNSKESLKTSLLMRKPPHPPGRNRKHDPMKQLGLTDARLMKRSKRRTAGMEAGNQPSLVQPAGHW